MKNRRSALSSILLRQFPRQLRLPWFVQRSTNPPHAAIMSPPLPLPSLSCSACGILPCLTAFSPAPPRATSNKSPRFRHPPNPPSNEHHLFPSGFRYQRFPSRPTSWPPRRTARCSSDFCVVVRTRAKAIAPALNHIAAERVARRRAKVDVESQRNSPAATPASLDPSRSSSATARSLTRFPAAPTRKSEVLLPPRAPTRSHEPLKPCAPPTFQHHPHEHRHLISEPYLLVFVDDANGEPTLPLSFAPT